MTHAAPERPGWRAREGDPLLTGNTIWWVACSTAGAARLLIGVLVIVLGVVNAQPVSAPWYPIMPPG